LLFSAANLQQNVLFLYKHSGVAPVASGLDRPPYATILAILASLRFAIEF